MKYLCIHNAVTSIYKTYILVYDILLHIFYNIPCYKYFCWDFATLKSNANCQLVSLQFLRIIIYNYSESVTTSCTWLLNRSLKHVVNVSTRPSLRYIPFFCGYALIFTLLHLKTLRIGPYLWISKEIVWMELLVYCFMRAYRMTLALKVTRTYI